MIDQPWGTSTPTRIARLDAECVVVVQRLTDAATASRAVGNARLLAAASLPGPVPIGEARDRFVAWHRAPGTSGPLLLGTSGGGWLADQMGQLARRLERLPSGNVPIDPAWRTPADLRRATASWLDLLAGEDRGVPELRDAIRRRAERVCRSGWSPRPTHGDFVPANVIVRDRRIEALLDVSGLALRHPELDVAWWELVVGFHHPGEVVQLTRFFRRGYGADDPAIGERLPDLAAVRALQLAALATPAGRPHAVALLLAAAAAPAA